MRPARTSIAALTCIFIAAAAMAQEAPKKVPAQRSQVVDGDRKLEIVDLAPRFLDFYEAARSIEASSRNP